MFYADRWFTGNPAAVSEIDQHLKFRSQPDVGKPQLMLGETVNLLYRQSRTSLFAHAVLLPLMAYIYLHGVPVAWVAAWAGALVLAVTWRLSVVRRYFSSPILAEDIPKWERRFVASLALVGLLWGLPGGLFTRYLGQTDLIVSILVLVGLSAGGLSAFGHHRPSHAAFSWPLLLPFALYWLLGATHEGAVIGASLLLYLALTTRVVTNFQDGLREVMATSYDQMTSIGELTHLTRQLAGANQALNEHEEYLKAVLNAMSDGLCVIDAEGEIIGVTPSLCAMFGYAEADLLGRDVSLLVGGEHRLRHAGYIRAHRERPMKTLVRRIVEGDGLHYDGTTFPVEVSVTETLSGGKPIYVGLVRNITERRAMIAKLEQTLADLRQEKEKVQAANEELSFLSTHDALTGLPNRRYFDDFSGRMWRHAQRRHETMSILLLDIDHFKQYNDHFGHLAGDACLVRIAETLARQINRAGDLAARYGGEEFIVFLSNTDVDGARHIAEGIRREVQSIAIPHPTSASGAVTVSAGIAACSPVKGSRIDQLVSRADSALYAAKAAGRNRVEVFAAAGPEDCRPA
ncbi:MAG: diguanylate cyclase [Betaproteobacteria bacterium]|nr:diguanylate cyclase [Betaproteobacteria bacterium]